MLQKKRALHRGPLSTGVPSPAHHRAVFSAGKVDFIVVPSFFRHTFLVFYKVLMAELEKAVRKIPACKTSDSAEVSHKVSHCRKCAPRRNDGCTFVKGSLFVQFV